MMLLVVRVFSVVLDILGFGVGVLIAVGDVVAVC